MLPIEILYLRTATAPATDILIYFCGDGKRDPNASSRLLSPLGDSGFRANLRRLNADRHDLPNDCGRSSLDGGSDDLLH